MLCVGLDVMKEKQFQFMTYFPEVEGEVRGEIEPSEIKSTISASRRKQTKFSSKEIAKVVAIFCYFREFMNKSG